MQKSLIRALALVICLALIVPTFALGTESEEDTSIITEMSPEELEQWAQWEKEKEEQKALELILLEKEAELAAVMETDSDADTIEYDDLELNKDLPDNIVNILLLGIDTRPNKLAKTVEDRKVDLVAGRSDANIICSINLNTGSVKLTSIARDVMVTIPGYKNQLRVNVAFYYGGMNYKSHADQIVNGAQLAMKTINRNFKLNIQRYVVVNIFGLSNIIDELGGIDMELTKAEAGRINFELKKEPMDDIDRLSVKSEEGVHHLDGMQAVTFARIRGLDNDNERTSRQRKLLETLLEKVMANMDIATFTNLVKTALPFGATNLTAAELLQYGAAVITGEAMQNLSSGEAVISQMRIPICKGDVVNGVTYTKNMYGFKDSMTYLNKSIFKTSIEEIHTFIYGQ